MSSKKTYAPNLMNEWKKAKKDEQKKNKGKGKMCKFLCTLAMAKKILLLSHIYIYNRKRSRNQTDHVFCS